MKNPGKRYRKKRDPQLYAEKQDFIAVRHRHGEIVAASGDQCDFDAAGRSIQDSLPVDVRKPGFAVEKRTVNVQGNEPYRHSYSLPC